MCAIFKNETPQIKMHQAKLDVQNWQKLAKDGMKVESMETPTFDTGYPPTPIGGDTGYLFIATPSK